MRDGSNWFAYVNNDPVNWVDLWGLLPGDIFPTIDAAAIDFGLTTNSKSIDEGREYSTTFYKSGNGYTYMEPLEGEAAHFDSFPLPPGGINDVLAGGHTHGRYDKGYDNNNFSKEDIKVATANDKLSYVVTTNGSLLEYNPATGKTVVVSTNMPFDKNDPTSPHYEKGTNKEK